MSKVVLTGAGFSVPAGLPPMRGFFGRVQELVNDPMSGLGGHEGSDSKDRIPDRSLTGSVLAKWQSSRACDDLESFCASLDETSQDRWDTVYVIARTLQLSMERARSPVLWRSFYRRFAREVADRGDITVISLNYDLLLDQAFLHEHIRIDYALDAEHAREVNTSHKPADHRPIVRLLKPHGSMNFLVCPEPSCDIITLKWERGAQEPDTGWMIPANWPTGPEQDHTGEHKACAKNLQFLLVPPAEDKGDGDKAPYARERERLQTVWNAVKQALAEADEIYFLANSLPPTDQHWQKLLLEQLDCCRHAHVVNVASFVDDVRDLMDRFRRVASDRFPLTAYLGKYVGDVARYGTAPWRDALLG